MKDRPAPKLTKTLKYLPYIGCYIGRTTELKQLVVLGYELRYEVGITPYQVQYAPRFRTDPKPWVQVGGLESRLSSGEIGAY